MSGSGVASAIFVENRDAMAVARLDPRVRLVAALLFLTVLAFLRTFPALAAALAAGFAIVVWARPPLRSTLRRLAEIEGFLVLLLVSLPLAMPGTPIFSLFGLSASWEGVDRALTILVRVNAAVLVIAGLLSTMGTMRLAAAMAGIGVPASLAHLFQLTVRYIAVFNAEYMRLRRAMRARAFRAGSNRHSWRTLGNLLGMLLVRSMERAERVTWAMKCRGFSGRFPGFEHRPIGVADLAFMTIWIVALATLIALEFSA
jgi:cobalt/nickel transport system permease protein